MLRLWVSDCSCGMIPPQSFFFAYAPVSPQEKFLYSKLLLMQELNPVVKTVASKFREFLSIPTMYCSLHLRLEPDLVNENPSSVPEKVSEALKEYCADTGRSVFIASGLPKNDTKVLEALGSPEISSLGFNFFFIEDIFPYYPMRTLNGDKEIEFLGAVTYQICFRASSHIGVFSSSFDYMLAIERKLKLNTTRTHNMGDLERRFETAFPGIL